MTNAVTAEAAGLGAADAQSPAFDAARRREFRDYLEGAWDRQRAALVALRAAMRRRRVVLSVGGTLLAAGGVALYALGYREWLLYEVLAVLAGAAILAVALHLRFRKRIIDQPELEKELDACVDADCELLLRRFEASLPPGGGGGQQLAVFGFPDRARLGAERPAGRVGSDGKMRITPFGVSILRLDSATVSAYQAAVEISSGAILFEVIREFPYTSIVSIDRLSSASKAPARGRASQRETRDDAVSLTLADNSRIALVQRDGAYVESWAGKDIPQLAQHADLGEVGRLIRRYWLAAVTGGEGAAG